MLTIAAVQILIFGAELETLVPVGTVTGMLVAIFVVFMKDSARQDARVDGAKDSQISQLIRDRDEARAETAELRLQCAMEDREWRAKERGWNQERQELYDKLARQHREDIQ